MFNNYLELKSKLSFSKFRSSFKLSQKDKDYIDKLGLQKIQSHAVDFIDKRISAKDLANDGKQTPFKGHPVFVAQHATATCCRKCIKKWHGIEKNKPLSSKEAKYILNIIMQWIKSNSDKYI